MTDLRIMSSVQPPFNRAIWSAWHIVVKGVIFLAMRMMRLMARSVRLMTLIRLCGSELIEYCCKKITIKQCQQYFYLDAAQCKKTVSQNLFLILLFVFFKGRTTLLSSQPHLTINKQTILLRCCKSKESKMNPMQTWLCFLPIKKIVVESTTHCALCYCGHWT